MDNFTEEFNRAGVRSYHDVLLLEETKRKYSRTTTSFRSRNAMEWLYAEGDKKMSEIADYLRISRPSATTLIKKLEELDYIRRYRDGDDKRSEYVALTRKGQLVTAYQMSHRKGVIDEVAKEFTDEELHTIVKCFNRLSEVFESCCETLEQGTAVSERNKKKEKK